MRFRNFFEDLAEYNHWRYDKWHPWFAWYPVTIKGQFVWLEWVERCIRENCFSDYRLPGDTEKTEIEIIAGLDNSLHEEVSPKIWRMLKK